jgi:hypothetical protein
MRSGPLVMNRECRSGCIWPSGFGMVRLSELPTKRYEAISRRLVLVTDLNLKAETVNSGPATQRYSSRVSDLLRKAVIPNKIE